MVCGGVFSWEPGSAGGARPRAGGCSGCGRGEEKGGDPPVPLCCSTETVVSVCVCVLVCVCVCVCVCVGGGGGFV